VCWRVQEGKFTNNKMHNNGRSGICIGHKDSGNVFEQNHIHENKYYGIYMRPETEANGAHNNIYKNNIIEDNGNNDCGYGIFIDTVVRVNIIEDNVIRDNGNGVQTVGIQINHKLSDLIINNPNDSIMSK
jgi:parallel beta-helix repeat protein